MENWSKTNWIIFSAPFVLLILAAIVWMLAGKTIRSRKNLEKILSQDTDIHDHLVVFGWSRKILYIPTVIASILAATVCWLDDANQFSALIGGFWTAVFLLNFLIDEYELSVTVLAVALIAIFAMVMWLLVLGWLDNAVEILKSTKIKLNTGGYILMAALFSTAMLISWLRGMFSYVAFTPNYMNIQSGVSETGQQISREMFATRVDTGDFLERILGFGWIVITFSDPHRPPMRLLVGNIGVKAAKLEAIRGKIVIDR